MRLTDKAIRAARPLGKPYKLSDGRGLYLLVQSTGSRSWKLKYRLHGKEAKLTLGSYPEISLSMAREKATEARTQLAQGVDPAREKRIQHRKGGISLQNIAAEWIERRKRVWTPSTYKKTLSRLERFVYPTLGRYGIVTIEAPDILDVLRDMEGKGANEQTHRVQQHLSQIFRYAIATRRAQRDPTADIRGALVPIRHKTFNHLKAVELPDFLAKLEQAPGSPVVRLATLFLAHTFVRTAEMRLAKWSEISWDEKLWSIPAERMKMRRPHLVPLSKQAIKILRDAEKINGVYEYIFATLRHPDKPLSENAVLYLLYRIGYHGKATGHGFRATASTILNERGFAPDAIERQLAHIDSNAARKAYNHAQYITERRKMMQWWSDYLDKCAAQSDAVAIQ